MQMADEDYNAIDTVRDDAENNGARGGHVPFGTLCPTILSLLLCVCMCILTTGDDGDNNNDDYNANLDQHILEQASEHFNEALDEDPFQTLLTGMMFAAEGTTTDEGLVTPLEEVQAAAVVDENPLTNPDFLRTKQGQIYQFPGSDGEMYSLTDLMDHPSMHQVAVRMGFDRASRAKWNITTSTLAMTEYKPNPQDPTCGQVTFLLDKRDADGNLKVCPGGREHKRCTINITKKGGNKDCGRAHCASFPCHNACRTVAHPASGKAGWSQWEHNNMLGFDKLAAHIFTRTIKMAWEQTGNPDPETETPENISSYWAALGKAVILYRRQLLCLLRSEEHRRVAKEAHDADCAAADAAVAKAAAQAKASKAVVVGKIPKKAKVLKIGGDRKADGGSSSLPRRDLLTDEESAPRTSTPLQRTPSTNERAGPRQGRHAIPKGRSPTSDHRGRPPTFRAGSPAYQGQGQRSHDQRPRDRRPQDRFRDRDRSREATFSRHR